MLHVNTHSQAAGLEEPDCVPRGERRVGCVPVDGLVTAALALVLVTEFVLCTQVTSFLDPMHDTKQILLAYWQGLLPYWQGLVILLSLVLPSLLLPVLSLLHPPSRRRYLPLLLLVPPSPLLLYLVLLYRRYRGEDHQQHGLASRAAGLVQALLSSLPILLLSLVSMLQAVVTKNAVDTASLHAHVYSHEMMTAATTLSIINLLFATIRYGERLTGGAVTLLVGMPFLLSNIGLRLLGFSLLLTFASWWVFGIIMALHFVICGVAVMMARGEGDVLLPGLLLVLVNMVVPSGYTRDYKLGHPTGR